MLPRRHAGPHPHRAHADRKPPAGRHGLLGDRPLAPRAGPGQRQPHAPAGRGGIRPRGAAVRTGRRGAHAPHHPRAPLLRPRAGLTPRRASSSRGTCSAPPTASGSPWSDSPTPAASRPSTTSASPSMLPTSSRPRTWRSMCGCIIRMIRLKQLRSWSVGEWAENLHNDWRNKRMPLPTPVTQRTAFRLAMAFL